MNPSPIRKTLGRQFSWTLPANAIYGVCGLLLLVVLNKLGSTAEAGRYSLALAITGPVFMFANLRFASVLGSDMRDQVPLADYFTVRAWLLLSAFGFVFVSVTFREATSVSWVLLFVALTKVTEAISGLCCGVQQRIERMDRIAISLVANGVSAICVFAAIYSLTRNLALASAGIAAARLLVMLCYDIPMTRKAAQQPVFSGTKGGHLHDVDSLAERRHRKWTLMLSAAPLGITATLISLTSNIPRYVLTAVFDERKLGMYASIAIVLQAGNLVFRAVEQPVLPRLALAAKQRDATRFWRLLISMCGVFLAIALVGGVISFLFGGQLLSLVFTSKFRTFGTVLSFVTVAAAVAQIAGMIESSLIAARLIAVQVPMHIVTVVSCLLLSLFLIPRYELYGAVLSVTICRFPFMCIGVWLLRQKFAERVAPEGTADRRELCDRAAA